MSEEQVEIAVVPEKQKRPWWKKILRVFVWTFGVFIFLIALLSTLLWIYQDDVKRYVIAEVNKRVNTTIIVDPANIDLTIISSFPDVSVNFNDISALDATNAKKRDTLFTAKKIGLSFNIMDLFHGKYDIHGITLNDAKVKMWVDEKGKDNYHFLKEDTSAATASDTSHVSFAIQKVELQNVAFNYHNKKDKTLADVLVNNCEFTGNFGEELYDLGSTADIHINKLSSGTTTYFNDKPATADVELQVNNKTNTYTLQKVKLTVADLDLDVTGNAIQKEKNYSLDLAVKGENIDINSALSLLPSSYADDVADFESSGEFFLNGKVKGLYSDSTMPDITADFGINSGATISRKNTNVSLHNVALAGNYSNVKGSDGFKLTSFSASTDKSKFSGSFSFMGFSRPEYNAQLNGDLDLEELQGLLQLDTIEKMSGKMNLSFSGSGKPTASVPTVSDFRTFKTSGQVTLKGASVKIKGGKNEIDSISGGLSFDGNNVTISNFTAQSASNNIVISGNVKNLLGYIFTNKEVLNISGDLSSRNLDFDQLLDDNHTASVGGDSSYRLDLPSRMRWSLNTSVKKVKFRKFEASDVSGVVTMSNKRLVADPITFHSMDGSLDGSGMIDATMKDSLLITCNAAITNVDMTKMFFEFENFGQGKDTVITYNNIKGKLTSTVNFASMWSKDLTVNEHKIYADADISIANGELVGFLPLDALSRFVKLEDLRDVKFAKLSNTITIKDRVINIPKMDINSSAINVTMSGTHDFDNNVDYHFIVDMDELHAKKAKKANKKNEEFGEEIDDGGHRTRLYISMKGYIGDPDMSYDKKGAWQGIKEDVHQQKQDLRELLHNEFGFFKSDTASSKDKNKKDDRKKDDKFILAPENTNARNDNTLDDSGDY
ncbi:MAG TPA: AsmA-like C-terminal region-containing protein [Bacteroidia bacterium]|jgi:hypothetical protein|nr:AsmA-like C-terminal region-containing protein [Bacteroidia bacterium]